MTTTRAKKAAAPPRDRYPKIIESYSEPQIYPQGEPSAFNGYIRLRRYRITIEPIDEPREVLIERLRKLWRDTEYNTHLTHAFKSAAADLGIELDPAERAKDRR